MAWLFEQVGKEGIGYNMNLRLLASLSFIKLDLNFLHAVISMWDPNNHVFWFKTDEMCPLPEEFNAIVGWPT